MPWWVDLVGFLSLGVAAALLAWSGLPSGGRERVSDYWVFELLGRPLPQSWREDVLPIEIEIHLKGRLSAIVLSLLLAGVCVYLATSVVSFLAIKPASVGAALFGITTLVLTGLFVWRPDDAESFAEWLKSFKWLDVLGMNFWAWTVVVSTVVGFVILAL